MSNSFSSPARVADSLQQSSPFLNMQAPTEDRYAALGSSSKPRQQPSTTPPDQGTDGLPGHTKTYRLRKCTHGLPRRSRENGVPIYAQNAQGRRLRPRGIQWSPFRAKGNDGNALRPYDKLRRPLSVHVVLPGHPGFCNWCPGHVVAYGTSPLLASWLDVSKGIYINLLTVAYSVYHNLCNFRFEIRR
jgi:hypothetical protein